MLLTFGDVSWYECSEWFWWYLVSWAKMYVDSSVYVARSLLPEAKRTRYWAGTARHHRFTDDCAWDPGLHVLQCSLTSVPIIFAKRCSTHIDILHIQMHNYRHIRNTFFWVIFLTKGIAKGILGLNATCRNVCVVGRLFQGWDPEDPLLHWELAVTVVFCNQWHEITNGKMAKWQNTMVCGACCIILSTFVAAMIYDIKVWFSLCGISPRFVDVDFMPADISLFKNPNSKDHPAVMWKRPDDFCKGRHHVTDNAACVWAACRPRIAHLIGFCRWISIFLHFNFNMFSTITCCSWLGFILWWCFPTFPFPW